MRRRRREGGSGGAAEGPAAGPAVRRPKALGGRATRRGPPPLLSTPPPAPSIPPQPSEGNVVAFHGHRRQPAASPGEGSAARPGHRRSTAPHHPGSVGDTRTHTGPSPARGLALPTCAAAAPRARRPRRLSLPTHGGGAGGCGGEWRLSAAGPARLRGEWVGVPLKRVSPRREERGSVRR